MPNISRGFEAPNLTLQPTEIGVESTAAAARRIPAAYNQVADATATVGNRFARELGTGIALAGQVAEQHIAHQEISHGQLAATSKFAELTDQWNKITSDPNLDPNDTTIAQKFRDDVVEPQLEKLRDGFLTEHGQRWAESKVDSIRNHLWEKTAADMSTLAGVAVRNNVHQMANATSVTAMKDPSSVPFLLASIDSDVTALVSSSPNLKGADSAKVRETLRQDMAEKIVKAGAQGAIMSSGNPEKVAEEWGAKYPKYINGDELKQLSAFARAQIRANRADAAYSDHMRKVEEQDRSDKTETGYLQKLYSGDPKVQGQVSTKAIVNDPNLTRQAKERMIGVVEREMKPETAAQESNRNYVDVLAKIRSGEIDDVEPIYKARIDGKLNRADFNQAVKDFTDFRSPEGQRIGQAEEQFITGVKPLIDKYNPLMGHGDPSGPLQLYRLRMDMKAKVEEYRKAGKDWRDLFNPSKPDFLGKPEALIPYQKPLAQSLSDMAKRLSPAASAPEPRKPGESPAEYLKRTGAR